MAELGLLCGNAPPIMGERYCKSDIGGGYYTGVRIKANKSHVKASYKGWDRGWDRVLAMPFQFGIEFAGHTHFGRIQKLRRLTLGKGEAPLLPIISGTQRPSHA